MSEAEETQPIEEEEAQPTEEEATATEAAPEPTKPANQMKVVIVIKDANILLGVQSPDCDPVYQTMKGTLAAALKQVPILVKGAKKKWAAAPLYPKAVLPEPPPRSVPARTPAAPATPKAQPSFF
ncbi:hypothetical protein ES703_17006 [subsurface metagenome]